MSIEEKKEQHKADEAKDLLGSLAEVKREEMIPLEGPEPTLHYEMTNEEFNNMADGVSADQAADVIRHELQDALSGLKRSALSYWVAGRWLNWAHKTKVHGGHGHWKEFCDKCGISTAQAWKYRVLADEFTPEEIKSFGNERFNLEGALGYEAGEEPVEEGSETPPELTAESTELLPPATPEQKHRIARKSKGNAKRGTKAPGPRLHEPEEDAIKKAEEVIAKAEELNGKPQDAASKTYKVVIFDKDKSNWPAYEQILYQPITDGSKGLVKASVAPANITTTLTKLGEVLTKQQPKKVNINITL